MWSLLGGRGVEFFASEFFSSGLVTDIFKSAAPHVR